MQEKEVVSILKQLQYVSKRKIDKKKYDKYMKKNTLNQVIILDFLLVQVLNVIL